MIPDRYAEPITNRLFRPPHLRSRRNKRIERARLSAENLLRLGEMFGSRDQRSLLRVSIHEAKIFSQPVRHRLLRLRGPRVEVVSCIAYHFVGSLAIQARMPPASLCGCTRSYVLP